MENDAIDKIESSIPDISNMYNFWYTSAEYYVNISKYTKVSLPYTPTYLLILGDIDAMYKMPNGSESEGYWLSYRLSGYNLYLEAGPVVSGASEYAGTVDIYIWYK